MPWAPPQFGRLEYFFYTNVGMINNRLIMHKNIHQSIIKHGRMSMPFFFKLTMVKSPSFLPQHKIIIDPSKTTRLEVDQNVDAVIKRLMEKIRTD